MDNQKLLFKKFFNTAGSSAKSSDSSVAAASTGFNPPKFQFNKKKLGLEGFKAADTTKDTVKENSKNDSVIENIEMDSIPVEAFDETEIIESASAKSIMPIVDTIKTRPSDYDAIVGKNHQKYKLSSQLTALSLEIENVMRSCEDKISRIDLLILGLDEKIGTIS